jgi:ABC-type phosphate transport system permease subunit
MLFMSVMLFVVGVALGIYIGEYGKVNQGLSINEKMVGGVRG